MTEAPALLAWDPAAERWEPGDAAGGELAVADSWSLTDGRVRGWSLHMERFAGSCVAAGAGRSALEGPIRALPAALPGEGDWFPRLEMRRDGEPRFYLRVRPSPPRWQEAAVWPTHEDPRVSPGVKGPDIERLMALRARARDHGAEEAAILNDRDEAIEGAGCSVVWWREGELCLVPASEPILDGVTRRLVAELAERSGVPVARASLPLAEAGRREAWLVNALIGIVPVTGWVGHCDEAPVDLARLESWRRRLAEMAAPVG